MTRIVDNRRESLASVLNREFSFVDEIAIASAYFNVRGFGAIAEGLGDKPVKLLLGREPTESIKWEDEVLRELEECEDDPQYYKLLQQAIEFFKDGKREVRTITGKFFHGKAFIGARPSLKEVRSGVGVVGSSNFTYGGLVSNRELNMVNTDREVVQELSNWFEEQWSTSEDFKEVFINMLSNYYTTWSPYEVLAKALYTTYGQHLTEADRTIIKNMLPHQTLSYLDAKQKIEKYGGVVIADSTGLGKTMTALALAHNAVREGRKPMLIAPKSILDTTWRDEMRRLNITIHDTETAEMLSHNPDIVNRYIGEDGPDFIIVDEAHFFRNMSTNRYEALQRLVTRNNSQVVLLTATPINTSLMDLYALLSLYLPENILEDHNISLRDYFITQQKRWLSGEPVQMDDVLRRFIVRHSRELARLLDSSIKFPERVFDEKIKRYPISISLPKVEELLNRLEMKYYDFSIERLPHEFKLPDGRKVSEYMVPERVEQLKQLVKEIFKINVFKRLESSYAAFGQTLYRLKTYVKAAKRYAEQHRVFIPPAMKADILSIFVDEDEAEEIPDPQTIFSKPKYSELIELCRLNDDEVNDFMASLEHDEKVLEELLEMIPPYDEKFSILEERLREIIGQIKEPNGVIVFTQYADTANYLYNRLKPVFEKVMLVTGSGGYDLAGKHAEERELVEVFKKKGGILISTDVLSAGQNLQNAQYVVNYDFPWNPVVLIQRVGRIDRIGSSYERVYLSNVLPRNGNPDDPESLEYFLELMAKLYRRLELIRETIGLDTSTLGEKAVPRDFSIQARIARNDPSVLKELERRVEQFEKDPIDTLARILEEMGFEKVSRLPDGIGAVKNADFEGLFILFTDSNREYNYWVLHRFDDNTYTTSPTEIIDILLKGENRNRGEEIDYETLVPKMKTVKEWLKRRLEEENMKKITETGLERAPKKAREIYDKLAKADENLAILFREVASSKAILDQLINAEKQGNLIETAKQILPKAAKTTEQQKKPINLNLKRICWCYIRKTSKT